MKYVTVYVAVFVCVVSFAYGSPAKVVGPANVGDQKSGATTMAPVANKCKPGSRSKAHDNDVRILACRGSDCKKRVSEPYKQGSDDTWYYICDNNGNWAVDCQVNITYNDQCTTQKMDCVGRDPCDKPINYQVDYPKILPDYDEFNTCNASVQQTAVAAAKKTVDAKSSLFLQGEASGYDGELYVKIMAAGFSPEIERSVLEKMGKINNKRPVQPAQSRAASSGVIATPVCAGTPSATPSSTPSPAEE